MVQQNESSISGLPQDVKERLRAMLLRQESTLVENGDAAQQQEERIAQLERHVDRLATRCSALEAQNILVSVQVLDMFARTLAWTCSLSCLFLYGHVVCWWTSFCITDSTLDESFQQSSSTEQQDLMRLMIHSVGIWTLRLALLSMPYFYNRFTHGSFHRRFEVFAIAFIVIARVRLCRWRENLFMDKNNSSRTAGTSVAEFGEAISEEAIWEANYEVSARFLYVSILRLRGLWTKTAQYLSSRADFMPRSYVRELKRLQDEAPETAWKDVQQVLPESVLDALNDIDETPLASASIGQVHVAYVKATGEKVVVKVQHPHARTLLLDDFWSLSVILKIVSWMEPDYEFLEVLMREWATEARKELDFVTEAQNLRDARAAIGDLWPKVDSVIQAQDENGEEVPFAVEIPRPIDHLCTNDVLVMSFCEGVRLDDFDQIKGWGLSRTAVLNAVTQTFGHLMYNSHIFNGDPHIGNLQIRPGTGATKSKGFTLVLLDWGLAKRLSEPKRLAFCQLVYAASTVDFGLLMDAYKNLGLRLKKENVGRSMANVRFMLRDMATRDRARKRIKAKFKSDDKKTKEEGSVKFESKAYPGEIFFFVRVNELLHGLGSRFNVDMGFLSVLRPYAELGLRRSTVYNEVVSVPRSLTKSPSIDQALEKKLTDLLTELEAKKDVVGAQICILDKEGSELANLTAGTLGGLKSHVPMHPSALVLGYSCAKAITATLAHCMVNDGYLSYDEPICERVWPQFCPTEKAPPGQAEALGISKEEAGQRWHWKRQITLWHILTHQAGMDRALPAQLSIKDLASCEYCSASFQYNPASPADTLLPTKAPGTETAYHVMSFGWLVAGTLCAAYGLRHDKKSVTFEEVYETQLAPRLSRDTLSCGFRPCGGKGDFVLAQTAISDEGLSSVLQRRREMSAMGEGDESGISSSSAIDDAMKTFKGKEFLLDPRIWNSIDAIEANVPAAGGRFSAAGLARFYHDLGSGRILDKSIVDQITSLVVMEKSGSDVQGVTSLSDDDRTALGCGYQLLRFDKDTDKPSGFGHAGVGGSIGVFHRSSGISIGLMLNKADGGKETTLSIMRMISKHFNI